MIQFKFRNDKYECDQLFVTSDHHFNHENIIKYDNKTLPGCRPYTTTKEMDQDMILRWNEVVTPNSIVIHAGDFLWARHKHEDEDLRYARDIVNQLNGRIAMVWGNHKDIDCRFFHWLFTSDKAEIRVLDPSSKTGSRLIVINHEAQRVWNGSHYGSWHLYGHSHMSLPEDPNSLSFDVGVMGHGMRPWSYDEIAAKMAAKTFIPSERLQE